MSTFVQTEPLGVNASLAAIDLEALANAGSGGGGAYETNAGPATPHTPGTPTTPGGGRKATVRRANSSGAMGGDRAPTRSFADFVARMSTLSANSEGNASVAAARRGEISAEPTLPTTPNAPYVATVVEKSKEAAELIRKAVDECMLFSELTSEGRNELVAAFHPVTARKNELLIKEGDWGELFYVLETGTCDALKMVHNPRLGDRAPQKVKSYTSGGSFGELALMYNEPRAASIRVTSDNAKLWAIDRQTFKSISVHFKVLSQKLLDDKLRTVPQFKTLSSEEMARLVDTLEEKQWAAGDKIMTEGESGDEMFVVMEGKLKAVKGSGKTQPPATTTYLGPGDVFGEGALTATETRTMTVTCEGAAVTVSVSRTKLDDVLGPSGSREQRLARPMSVAPSKLAAMASGAVAEHPHRNARKQEDHQNNMRATVGRSTSPSNVGLSPMHAAALAAGAGGGAPPSPPLSSIQSPSRLPGGSFFANNANPHTGEIVLGVGTFGKVIIVRHKKTGETYAMKRLNKSWIVQNQLEQHVVDERNVMTLVDHPFILKLHNSFWDERHVYLILELCLGGELFGYLRRHNKFAEDQARFYAASVASAFDHIHSRFIIYRDLKPENLMLDDKGYLKVVDFGLAKVVKGRTWTICGTPEYLAPEVVLSKGHSRGVDYWALGVLIFELVAGHCPFVGSDNMEIYKRIIENKIEFPAHFSQPCREIVKDFTKASQLTRLGLRRPGFQAIRTHAWFEGFDWSALETLKMAPPIVPKVTGRLDTSNFEDMGEELVNGVEAEPCDWRPNFSFEVVDGVTQPR